MGKMTEEEKAARGILEEFLENIEAAINYEKQGPSNLIADFVMPFEEFVELKSALEILLENSGQNYSSK